jgi:hypothetical protein
MAVKIPFFAALPILITITEGPANYQHSFLLTSPPIL